MLEAIQKRLIYFPTRHHISSPEDAGLAYESVQLETSDGVRLHGWWVPSAEQSRPTVLFLHGNAGNISFLVDTLSILHRLRVNVFAVDYRGFGRSDGAPDEQGTYLDAEAAWDYVVGERGVDPSSLVVFGRSLGGGIASWLATIKPMAALVMESTFTSAVNVAADYYPWLPVRWIARVHYPTLERLPDIDVPLLFIHSPDDRVVRYHHGRELFEAANEPKRFLEIKGSHADGFLATGEPYASGLADFFETYAVGS